jgi:hypothetical protein
MLATTVLFLALAATGLSQVPDGYKKVYLTSNVNAKFAIVPKAAKSGSTTVVQTIDNKADQQWVLKEVPGNSTIQLFNTTLCLDGGAKSKSDIQRSLSLLQDKILILAIR